jgi:hypothetical protein
LRSALAAAVAGGAALTATTAGAGLPASARPLPAAAPQQAAAAARPLLLINGDRLTVTPMPNGRSAVSDLPASGGPDTLLSLRLGGRFEVIPADAVPYLGRGLDPGLFDLNVLQRAEAVGRLPVRVTFRGRSPSLPGVTITGSGRATAEGYLTVSSARAFGAALRQQFRTDHGGDSYGSDGLFAGGVGIAVAGAPLTPAKPVRPDFAMHTLTVTGTDLSGRPDNGDGAWVFNADNLAIFSDPFERFNPFYHGVAKFSVPTGHYWVIGDFEGFTSNGASGLTHLDVLPTVTVSRNTAVNVTANAATSEVTMATSRPAVPRAVKFAVVLGDRRGLTQSIVWWDFPGHVWVNPVARRPAVGTLQAFASELLTPSPQSAGNSYVYNLDFRDRAGIIPPQHYLVQPSSLAAVTERYYQDVRLTGLWQTIGGYPAELGVGFVVGPLPLPGVQVQYFSAAPGLLWNSSYYTFGGDWTGGQQDDAWRVLSPGQQQIVDWNRYPLHPQPDFIADLTGGELFPVIPSAIRTGDMLRLTTIPFSDNRPGHLGSTATGTSVTVAYEVDQNGVRIARGDGSNGIPPVTLSKRPSLIRFTLDAARQGPSYLLSASSQTVWTWRSGPQPDATVPPPWYCSVVLTGGQFQFLRRCAVQSMMTLNYQVHGLALNGTVPPGPQLIGLHAGHIQLAPATRITGAAAQVSCDDGKTWQRAAVSSSGGRNFRITFGAPGGCDLTLRVSAADAAGSSITETITRAYKIAS